MKKYKSLKLLALLLSALFLSSCAFTMPEHLGASADSTETVTESVPETTVPPETEKEDEIVYRYTGNPDYPILADAYLSALPVRDFDGATFIVTSPDTMFLDENEVYYVSDVVAKRNTAVEEKYNVALVSSKSNPKVMLEEAKQAALAGMYYTDVMCTPFGEVGTFVAEDLLMNLRSMPLLDLSQPYFDQSSVKALSAGYKTYGVAGEALPLTDLPCIIYNKNIAKELGITDIYEVALNGGLTWRKLLAYTELCLGSEKYTGAAIECGEVLDYVYTSLNQVYVFANELKYPTIGAADYSMNNPAMFARHLMSLGSSLGITKDTAKQAFNEGKVLFTIATVGALDDYRSPDVPVGILPMPKKDDDSDYKTMARADSLIMTVPNGVTNSEMTSLVLSALNAASYGYLTEKNSTYLHATTLPDTRSADVFELICHSAVYDFSTAFEKTVPILTDYKAAIRKTIETKDLTDFYAVSPYVNDTLAGLFPLDN